MTDLEDALKKLDRLTQEAARMAHEEALRIRQDIRDDTKIVDGKVEEVCDKVQGVAQLVMGKFGSEPWFELNQNRTEPKPN